MEMHIEELNNDDREQSVINVFNEHFNEDDWTIGIKYNLSAEYDLERNRIADEDMININNLVRFINDMNNDNNGNKIFNFIKAYTFGIHMNGKKNIPHVHINFIVEYNDFIDSLLTNGPQLRNRYFGAKKNNIGLKPAKNSVSIKTEKLRNDQPTFHFLAYPLKEGKYFKKKLNQFDGELMHPEMLEFLSKVAQGIYDQKIAKELAQKKSEERIEAKYIEVLDVAREYKKVSDNYREFQIFMEINYIEKRLKEGKNIPSIDNYKKYLKKSAVVLKYFKTYEL